MYSKKLISWSLLRRIWMASPTCRQYLCLFRILILNGDSVCFSTVNYSVISWLMEYFADFGFWPHQVLGSADHTTVISFASWFFFFFLHSINFLLNISIIVPLLVFVGIALSLVFQSVGVGLLVSCNVESDVIFPNSIHMECSRSYLPFGSMGDGCRFFYYWSLIWWWFFMMIVMDVILIRTDSRTKCGIVLQSFTAFPDSHYY